MKHKCSQCHEALNEKPPDGCPNCGAVVDLIVLIGGADQTVHGTAFREFVAFAPDAPPFPAFPSDPSAGGTGTAMTVKWGTNSKVMFLEPKSGLPLEIGASGDMRLRVEDERRLRSKLADGGPMPGQDELARKFRGILMSPVKALLARAIQSLGISIFEVDGHLDRLSAELRKELSTVFHEYGAALERFAVVTVVRPDGNREYEDLKKLHNSRFVDVEKVKIEREVVIIQEKTKADAILIATEAETLVTVKKATAGAHVRMADSIRQGQTPEPIRPERREQPSGMEPSEWYAAIGGNEEGPFSAAELKRAIKERRIARDTLVWREGMDRWGKIGEQPELAGLFSAVPPPLPTRE